MFLRLIGVIAFGLWSIDIASAQWVTNTSGGAFDDKPLHIALTAKRGGYGLGLRCRDSQSLELVYLTAESVDDSITAMNALSPIIRFRVDKEEIVELPATVENIDEKLVVIADATQEVFDQVRNAKSSVSIVITMMEKNFHENTFNVRGSTAAVDKITKACEMAPN